MPETVEAVAIQRASLIQAGFHCVEVETARLGDQDSGKAPVRREWQITDPTGPPAIAALNTGIRCAGLRAIDLDIDNPTLASRCQDVAEELLGVTLRRFRAGSARCLLLYRAADGEPHKIAITGRSHDSKTPGRACKIEVLGHGQQFVAFGSHWEGATLQWEPHPPGVEVRDDLIAVTEADIASFLQRCAPIIEAKWERCSNGVDPDPDSDHVANPELQADDPLRVARALEGIPNGAPADWEAWNRIGMAVWTATGGSRFGWELFNAWSARNPSYSVEQCRERWTHYPKSPPTRIGAGTLFYLENLARLEAPVAAEARQAGRPLILSLDDLAGLADPDWLLDGLIPEQSLIVPYGPPKAGKTFIMLSIGLHIAAGLSWFGRTVKYGAVVYVVGEGAGGVKHRVQAMLQAYDMHTVIPFWVVPRAVNFRDPAAVRALEELIRKTLAESNYPGVELRLLVIDTLARAMPGADENSAQDVGVVVAAADTLRENLATSVALVHHEGKDEGRGARGTSALRGAWDTGLRIVGEGRGAARTMTLEVADQRDAEAGLRLTFEMREIRTGLARSSLVPWLTEAQAPGEEPEAKEPKPTGKNAIALTALKNVLATDQSAILPPFDGVPTNTRGAHIDRWRQEYCAKQPGIADKTRNQAFRRAVDALAQRGLVGTRDPWVWLASNDEK